LQNEAGGLDARETSRDLSEGVYLSFRAAFSFLPLILFTVIVTAARCVLASHSLSLPAGSDKVSVVFQQLLVATWVYFDRQGRGLGLPFEFEAFVFFAWPIRAAVLSRQVSRIPRTSALRDFLCPACCSSCGCTGG
jgi:hypothetical protein